MKVFGFGYLKKEFILSERLHPLLKERGIGVYNILSSDGVRILLSNDMQLRVRCNDKLMQGTMPYATGAGIINFYSLILTVGFYKEHISSTALTDKELVALYKESGDMAVLGELYQRYMELVYGVCLKYYKEPETAKDSVMQIFEELVSKLKKHEVDNFKGWLHQVAKNHCLMQLRTPRNMKTVEFKTELVQSEENVHLNGVLEKEENFKKMEYCLGTLATEQQRSHQALLPGRKMLQRNSGNDRAGMEPGAEFDTEWKKEFEELYGEG